MSIVARQIQKISIGKKYPTNCMMSMKKEIDLSSELRKLLLRLRLGRIVSNVLTTQSIKVVTTSIKTPLSKDS